MKISQLKICGFRCFGSSQTIDLDNLTCFVGPNASGKSAAMIALARLFGESNYYRQIIPSDFFLKPGEKLSDQNERGLFIECKIEFPELLEKDENQYNAIPETFNQMVVDEPNDNPYCRIRLESIWSYDGTTEGNIEQNIFWIRTNSDSEEIIKDHKANINQLDRGKIRLIYIPATRDPESQIKISTNTTFGKLLKSFAWNGVDQDINNTLQKLQDNLDNLEGIKSLNTQIQKTWENLYNGREAQKFSFKAIDKDPTELLNLMTPTFQSNENGPKITANDLSDGFRSLFSLSLSFGFFNLEEILRSQPEEKGFNNKISDNLPLLYIFSVEEPENHLSPQYLGRVVKELNEISKQNRAQVIISSHSPSILGRIDPINVRYFLGHEFTEKTEIKKIILPENTDEAYKFIREAVRGYPELYFARLVILGEGPSEEIILKRIFEASGKPLDTYFISIVPLGGKHINHFWRLLQGIKIPYITLLDFDQEKEGAGWGRIQYIRDQLIKLYGRESERLKFMASDGNEQSLANETYDKIHIHNEYGNENIANCFSILSNNFNVFFSKPLDIDLSMLEAFTNEYTNLDNGRGPRLPKKNQENYLRLINNRVRQVLSSNIDDIDDSIGSSFSTVQKELFPWYKYLFIDGSKPVTHMRALNNISDEKLIDNAPETLKSLVKKADFIIKSIIE